MSDSKNKILLEGWKENIADLFHEADGAASTQRYIDIQSFASGGEKEIFTAYDQVTKRTIALARPVHKDYRNFLREARLTASLDHPSIINIYEISEEPEDTYFTMKMVDGESLVQAIYKKSTRESLTTFLTLCDGMSYAHSMDIVHLDLKPENVLLGHFGDTQIIDWGLAQRLNEKENKIGRSGTPGFMAPEQRCKIAEVDHRADVYALGAILKFILENNDGKQNLHEQTLKGRLLSVAMKAMAESPKNRYQTVADLKNEILLFLDGYATIAENASYLQNFKFLYKRNKKVFKLASAFLIILVLLTTYFLNSIKDREVKAKLAENKANKAQDIALIQEKLAKEAQSQATTAKNKALAATKIAKKAKAIANTAEEKVLLASKKAATEKHNASIMLSEITKMIMEMMKVSDPATKKALQEILTKARKSNTQGNLALLIFNKKILLTNSPDDKENWASLGDLYVIAYDFQMAAECYKKAGDQDSLKILTHIQPFADKGIDYQTSNNTTIHELFEINNNSDRWRSILYQILRLNAAIKGVGSAFMGVLTLYMERFTSEEQVLEYYFKGNRLSLSLLKGLDAKTFLEFSKLHIKYESFKLCRFPPLKTKSNLADFHNAISRIKAKNMDLSLLKNIPLKGILLNKSIQNIIVKDHLNKESLKKLREKFKVYNVKGKQL
ncbi:MAG: protein kinase [Lentisphaerales bacterium]|nr:protein kinase [Lentisphaerales bacterium]